MLDYSYKKDSLIETFCENKDGTTYRSKSVKFDLTSKYLFIIKTILQIAKH